MINPDQLERARTREHIGEYKAPDKNGVVVPIVEVYKAEIPEEARETADAETAEIYVFRPVTVVGDEVIFAGSVSLVAAVENVHKEGDGHIAADVGMALSGRPERAVDSPVIFRDSAQFKSLLGELTHVDRLDMKPQATKLSVATTQQLGFSAAGQPDVLQLDLQDNHNLAAEA